MLTEWLVNFANYFISIVISHDFIVSVIFFIHDTVYYHSVWVFD